MPSVETVYDLISLAVPPIMVQVYPHHVLILIGLAGLSVTERRFWRRR